MAKSPIFHDFSSVSWLDDKDWVLTPTQSRSRKTLQKILITSRQLFLQQGFEATTIAQISRESAVSVGSIYNLFSDKNAIFLSLYEHYRLNRVEQIQQMIDKLDWNAASAMDIVRFHIDIIFASSREDGDFLRLVEKQRANDPELYQILTQAEEAFCVTMLELYRYYETHFGHPDIDAAVRYLHYVIRGSALWSLLPEDPRAQFLDVTSDRYQEETVRMATGYLQLCETDAEAASESMQN